MQNFTVRNIGDTPEQAANRDYKKYKAIQGPKPTKSLNDFYKRYDPSIQAGKINRNVIGG